MKRLLALLIVVAFFTACSKSGTGTNQGPQRDGYLLHVLNFWEYDSLGRLTGKGEGVYNYNKNANTITINETDSFLTGFLTYTTTYTFANNAVTRRYSNAANFAVYYLNATDSLPDSLGFYNGPRRDMVYFSNVYDANHKLTTQASATKQFNNNVLVTSAANASITYTWQNGNLVKEAGDGFNYTFSYYQNQVADEPDQFYFIFNPFYKVTGSKNIKESQDYDFGVKDIYSHFDYTYDDKGRVVTSTQTDRQGRVTYKTLTSYY